MANVRDHSPEDTPEDSHIQTERSLQETQGEAAEGDSPAPPIPEEFMEGIPPEDRQAFLRVFGSVTQFAGPVLNPVLDKVSPEHISRIIDSIENESIREHGADSSRRKYQFAYFVIGACLIVGLIVFFTLSDSRDLIAPVVTGALGFLGGLAAGQRFRQ